MGPISIGAMSSVPEDLRGQANALKFFFIHLLGGFPSSYLTGIASDYIGMFWAIFILFNWVIFGIIAWYLTWNYARFFGGKTFW